jgi:hypothetical protein
VTATVTTIEPTGISIVDHEISARYSWDDEVQAVVTTTYRNTGGQESAGPNYFPNVRLYSPDGGTPLEAEFVGNGAVSGPLLLEPGDEVVTESTFTVAPEATVARYEVGMECAGGSMSTDPQPYC